MRDFNFIVQRKFYYADSETTWHTVARFSNLDDTLNEARRRNDARSRNLKADTAIVFRACEIVSCDEMK